MGRSARSRSSDLSAAERARQQFAREEARTAWMGRLMRGAFVSVALGICLVIAATNVPQYRELRRLDDELAEVKRLEADALERREQSQTEREALQTDEEYLQLKARDRLDKALPGESIIRIERP